MYISNPSESADRAGALAARSRVAGHRKPGRARRAPRWSNTLLALFLPLLQPDASGRDLTWEKLQRHPDLTPRRFARLFSAFKYQYHAARQAPEVFLATRTGDCDDYARLAAKVLRQHGYTTKLVLVRLPEEAHMVCYVAETRSYLDYNNRQYLIPTVSANDSLTEIAAKVARSFDSPWISVAESPGD